MTLDFQKKDSPASGRPVARWRCLRQFLNHPFLPFLLFPAGAFLYLLYGAFNAFTDAEYESAIAWVEWPLQFVCWGGLLLGISGMATQLLRGHRVLAVIQGFFFGLFVLGTLMLRILAEMVA